MNQVIVLFVPIVKKYFFNFVQSSPDELAHCTHKNRNSRHLDITRATNKFFHETKKKRKTLTCILLSITVVFTIGGEMKF